MKTTSSEFKSVVFISAMLCCGAQAKVPPAPPGWGMGRGRFFFKKSFFGPGFELTSMTKTNEKKCMDSYGVWKSAGICIRIADPSGSDSRILQSTMWG